LARWADVTSGKITVIDQQRLQEIAKSSKGEWQRIHLTVPVSLFSVRRSRNRTQHPIERHGSVGRNEAVELGSRQISRFWRTRQFLEFSDCLPDLLAENPIGYTSVEPQALEPTLNAPAFVRGQRILYKLE
jgi:hypothetical protein